MRIIATNDIHSTRAEPYLRLAASAAGCGLAIIAGDCCDMFASEPLQQQWVKISDHLRRLAQEVPVLALCSGNHDVNYAGTAGWLQDLGLANVVVDGQSRDLGAAVVTVLPWWFHSTTLESMWLHGQALARGGAKKPWVVVVHAPPSETAICQGMPGRPAAFHTVCRRFIEHFAPDFVVSGHLHQAPYVQGGSWAARIGPSWCFNAGRREDGSVTQSARPQFGDERTEHRRGRGQEGLQFVPADAEGRQLGLGHGARLAFELVDDLQEIGPPFDLDPTGAEKLVPGAAVVDPEMKVRGVQPEGAEEVDGECQQLSLAGGCSVPEEIAIELGKFAQPAVLLLLVAEEGSDGEPLHRLLALAVANGDHARHGRRHFRSQRHGAVALVGEVEELANEFPTALLEVEILLFEEWSVALRKRVGASHTSPSLEDVSPNRLFSRVEIAEAWERLEREFGIGWRIHAGRERCCILAEQQVPVRFRARGWE